MSNEDLAAASNSTVDRWINLFGAADRARATEVERVKFSEDDIDSLVKKLEGFVVDGYKSGGVTMQAKDDLDQMINSVSRRCRITYCF
ncbi:MAG: hypothetical protein P8M18_05760 [Woeseiaceae bacterium]|nr:hypothetical protein [Woeseiaceae bacterium]